MLRTTVIGAYPKPEYLPTQDWFRKGAEFRALSPRSFAQHCVATGPLVEKAVGECLHAQSCCGVDVPTDGELARENYVHHFCRGLVGIDFEELGETAARNNACTCMYPRVLGPISRPELTCAKEWLAAVAQLPEGTDRVSLKFTLPGPMTILDTCACPAEMRVERARELAAVLNAEIQALKAAGCKQIQVDEPLFARFPQDALNWGIPLLDVVFKGIDDVERSVHMCCGYPFYLDQTDYKKAEKNVYVQLAPALDASDAFDVVSLEDAHSPNDFAELLPLYTRKTVCLGVVAVAKSRVESVEEIAARVSAALQHIPPERLMLAPDCGLGFLTPELAAQKLTVMVSARDAVRSEYEARLRA